MKMNDDCLKRTAIFLLVLYALLPASAIAGERRPFDLSKVPMDEGWEDTGINAYTIEPCGKDSVYLGLEYLEGEPGKAPVKLRVRNLITGVEKTSGPEPRQTQEFLGCTPDSRFLLIKTFPLIEKYPVTTPHINKIHLYDTGTMKEVSSYPYDDEASLGAQRLSPDGRYLLAGEKLSSIPLPDGREITVLPLLHPFGSDVADVAWSGDARIVYVLNKSDPQKLIIHNVGTGQARTVALDFGASDFFALGVLVHPETGNIYIHTGISSGFHVESIEYLFLLDPSKLPKRGKTVTAKPRLLDGRFASVAFGPDETLLFGLMPDMEAETAELPAEYQGIFMADLDGQVLRHITKGRYELNPVYMAGRNCLIVTRQEDVFNVGIVTKRAIYRGKAVQQSASVPIPR